MAVDWLKLDEEFALATAVVGETIELDGLFTNYIFQNDNFTIAAFEHSSYESFVVTGAIPFELKNGREYHIRGVVSERLNERTNNMERQLRVEAIAVLPPKGEVGIVRYLQSLDGIQLMAFRLYDKYKDDTLHILKSDPERVARDVQGMSLKKAMNIQQQLIDSEDASVALTWLLNLGFNMKEAENMVRVWGETIMKMVQDNPFILCQTSAGFPGVSFRKADQVAIKLGTDLTSDDRMEAGIAFAMEVFGNSGHVFSDVELLISEAKRVLSNRYVSIDIADVEEKVEEMLKARTVLYAERENIYLKKLYFGEKDLADVVVGLSHGKNWSNRVSPEAILDGILKQKNIQLEARQREAVLNFTQTKGGFHVLLGAAGTGKTFIVKIIMEVLEKLYASELHEKYFPVLLSPTGKAAKVLRKATGMPASTIHSYLKPDGAGGFIYNIGARMGANVVIVDEGSMLDTLLAKDLFEAVADGAKVILMGDPNQLPSIGAGNVLHDIAKSGVLGKDVVTLNVAKRQVAGSIIAENGTRIIKGEVIENDNASAFKINVSSPEKAADYAIQTFNKMMAAPYNVNEDDIQILSPMKKGVSGTNMLNYRIQQMVNGGPVTMTSLNKRFTVNNFQYELFFKPGDRVIQLSNNPDLQWFDKDARGNYSLRIDQSLTVTNGETGVIDAIYTEDVENERGIKRKTMVIAVKFDDGYVKYIGNDKQDLDHAWVITAHKSQGSQWKVVIGILTNEQRMMLDNSLLYTMYTRAEEKIIVLTQESAYQEALHTRKALKRRTTLQTRLK